MVRGAPSDALNNTKDDDRHQMSALLGRQVEADRWLGTGRRGPAGYLAGPVHAQRIHSRARLPSHALPVGKALPLQHGHRQDGAPRRRRGQPGGGQGDDGDVRRAGLGAPHGRLSLRTGKATQAVRALGQEYHPPIENPELDVAGYCEAVVGQQGFLGPWVSSV